MTVKFNDICIKDVLSNSEIKARAKDSLFPVTNAHEKQAVACIKGLYWPKSHAKHLSFPKKFL
jgi:hypothetical protein